MPDFNVHLRSGIRPRLRLQRAFPFSCRCGTAPGLYTWSNRGMQLFLWGCRAEWLSVQVPSLADLGIWFRTGD